MGPEAASINSSDPATPNRGDLKKIKMDAEKFSAKNCNTFPWKLHLVLERAEDDDFQDIVSWIPGEKSAFRVHKPEKFVQKILPRFFQQSKYKSFQRQCNLWGFERITKGPNKGGYTRRENFIRGDLSLIARIRRQKIKGKPSSYSPFESSSAHDVCHRIPKSISKTVSLESMTNSMATEMIDRNIARNASFDCSPSLSKDDDDTCGDLWRLLDDVAETTSLGFLEEATADDFGLEGTDFHARGFFEEEMSPNAAVVDKSSITQMSSEDPCDHSTKSSASNGQSSVINWLIQSKLSKQKTETDVAGSSSSATYSPEDQRNLSPICAALRSSDFRFAPPRYTKQMVPTTSRTAVATSSDTVSNDEPSTPIRGYSSPRGCYFHSFASKAIVTA